MDKNRQNSCVNEIYIWSEETFKFFFTNKYIVFQVVINAMKEDQAGKRTESEKHAILIVREVPVMSWCRAET